MARSTAARRSFPRRSRLRGSTMEWREAGGKRWLEMSLPGAVAAFTTRGFGSAKASLEPLTALGIDPSRVVSAQQVHGVELAFHDRGKVPEEADGHVVEAPGR